SNIPLTNSPVPSQAVDFPLCPAGNFLGRSDLANFPGKRLNSDKSAQVVDFPHRSRIFFEKTLPFAARRPLIIMRTNDAAARRPKLPMSWSYRTLLRPALFSQDSEKIHDRTMGLLARA